MIDDYIDKEIHRLSSYIKCIHQWYYNNLNKLYWNNIEIPIKEIERYRTMAMKESEQYIKIIVQLEKKRTKPKSFIINL